MVNFQWDFYVTKNAWCPLKSHTCLKGEGRGGGEYINVVSYMLKGGGGRGVHKCGICISNFEHAFVCKEKTVASRVSMQQKTLGDLFNL